MEIEIASTTPSISNQLRNANTVRWESGNVTTQPWEINNWLSKSNRFCRKRWYECPAYLKGHIKEGLKGAWE